MVRKSLFICLSILCCVAIANATETFKTKYNAQTGRPDWVHNLSTVTAADMPGFAVGAINWEDPTVLSAVGTATGWASDGSTKTVSTYNVGIGSTTPRAKLDVDGAIYATSYYGSGANLTGLSTTDIYWTGTATNLVAATARTSLELGTAAQSATTDFEVPLTFASGLTRSTNTINVDSGIYALKTYVTGLGYLTAVASDSDWTTHGSYPAACPAGEYISALGDTSTCGTPVDTNTNSATLCAGDNKFLSGEGNCITIDSTIYKVAGTYVTGVTADKGLLLTGTGLGLIETCTDGQILEWNDGTSVWACGDDTTGSGSGTPGGSSTQIQYNNAGAFGGIDGVIYNGTSITSTRNVGIGTTAPVSALQVVGTITGDLTGTASTATAVADADKGDVTISSGAWAVEDDSHAHGTTTLSGIDISADTNLTAGDALTLTDDDLDFDGGATPQGELGGTWASPTIDDGISITNLTLVTPALGTPASGVVTNLTGTAANVTVGTANAVGTLATLNVTGNVGIGTTTPLANLQVGAGAASMTLTTALGTSDALVKGRLEVDGNVYLNGNVGIGTTLLNSRLTIVGAGNVGINSASPTSQLSVDGTIYLKNITAGGSHGAARTICWGIDGVIYSVSSGACN